METQVPPHELPEPRDVPAFYSAADVQARNTVGLLMKRGIAVLFHNLEHRMQVLDLTGTQWIPLLHVAHGFDTVVSCAREMQVDAAAVTRMLDRLEAKGLVTRERSTEDRRVVRLGLTPQGAEVAGRIPEILADTLNRQLQGFTVEEVQGLVGLLHRFIANGEDLARASGSSLRFGTRSTPSGDSDC